MDAHQARSSFDPKTATDASEFSCDGSGGFGETLRQPAFGGAVGRAGADSDNGTAHTDLLEAGKASGASPRSAVETNAVVFGQGIENTCAVQEFQIVEALVARDLALARYGNRARQQGTAAVAGVSDPFGNTGDVGDGGALEGVLQKNGAVEVFAREGAAGGPFFGESPGRIGDHAVAKRLALVEVRDPGLRENRNFSLGKALAERAQGGQGHDGVAQPVGGADQDAIVRHSS